MTQTKAQQSGLPGIPVEFDEGTQRVRTDVCAECGASLVLPWGGAYGHDGYLLQCANDRAHRGIKKAETSLEYAERREHGDRFLSLLRTEDGFATLVADVRARLLDNKKPVADRDVAAFLMDCAKVGLDPFSRQIFPVAFEDRGETASKGTPVYRLTTMIAVRGLGSIAQRAMPETWVMAPSGEPVTSDDSLKALLLEGATRKRWTQNPETKRNIQVDEPVNPDRVLMYKVRGKLRLQDGTLEETDWVYGSWHLDDGVYGTEKGNTPMNMARNRAMRGWYEHYFPAARAIMQGLQVPMLERAAGFIAAMRIVEGKATAVEDAIPAFPQPPHPEILAQPPPEDAADGFGAAFPLRRASAPTAAGERRPLARGAVPDPLDPLRPEQRRHLDDLGWTQEGVLAALKSPSVTAWLKSHPGKTTAEMIAELRAAKVGT